jgi:hypothetical protein
LEVDALKRFEAQVAEPQPIHWAVKLGLFIASAIVFCVVFNLALAVSWATVLLFAVAILFHELGHFAGMWVFGYRDLQIFFIPAFGAMTTGIKHETRAWQKAIPGAGFRGSFQRKKEFFPSSSSAAPSCLGSAPRHTLKC